MALPHKQYNIYPKTRENAYAVLSYYFDDYFLFNKKEGVEFIMQNDTLSMNQIEFVARKLSECWPTLFREIFSENTISYENIMNIGILALTIPESRWGYSKSNQIRPIIRKFITYVNTTEVDLNYLITNN